VSNSSFREAAELPDNDPDDFTYEAGRRHERNVYLAEKAELEEKLANALAGWKRTALDLDGYEGGVPAEGTRLARAEHELGKARAILGNREAVDAKLRAMLTRVLESAVPHPREHPTMWKACGDASELLGHGRDWHRIPTSDPERYGETKVQSPK
jgi:hypothetical protein